MPDADIDFADKDRYKIIDYVIEKYGRESVSQIINFGRMKAKMVGGRCCPRHGHSRCRGVEAPWGHGRKRHPKSSIASNGELAQAIKNNSRYEELFKHAKVLEGLARQAGMHAGGVIIAPNDVVNWAPLFKQPDSDIVMTQYDMKYVEEVGLIKMDFLGLITLTILQETLPC